MACKEAPEPTDSEPMAEQGDCWDHTAVDPEHRLLLSIIPDKRTGAPCDRLVADVKKRTAGRTDVLITSDEHPPYRGAIERAYAQEIPVPKTGKQGRPCKPRKVLPPDLCYATVRKTRTDGRVTQVVRTVVFGVIALLAMYLHRSTVSTTINTAFVERNNGTDRHQNSRKRRKTYGFSKDWEVHAALSFYVGYSYNWVWPGRTLRVRVGDGPWRERTPAMAAGLAAHVWTVEEWVTYPATPG